jgi:hypothetical protein
LASCLYHSADEDKTRDVQIVLSIPYSSYGLPCYPLRRLQQAIGDIVRRVDDILPFARSRGHQNRMAAQGFASSNIDLHITYHVGAVEVDIMLFGCPMKQRCLGLATLTPVIGMVGTIVDGIHPGTTSSQLTPHFVMNLSQRLLSEIASGYARLVGDYHYLEAIFIQKPYRIGDSGQYLEILRPTAVVDIPGNGAIPV